MTGQRSRDLVRLAGTVLQPGFAGTTPPPWVLRLLGEGLGGVALFGRNIEHPAQLAALTAALRAVRPDVIVAIDEEAGDVTRLETLMGSSRPGNLALGAVDDVALTEAVARDLGHDLAAAGVTLNYAPDADVNTDSRNPVIGVRSFGADPDLVARHTAAWITGLQSAGVAACAKHFPGHGNTSVDSHIDVPRINASRAELDAVELPPFRAAIAAGTQAIMTGHLVVPAIDPEWPATLSRRVLVGLLRDELGFAGAVVTDGIEMAAIARRYGFEAAAVRALAAGSDAVCVGGDHFDEGDALRLRDAVVEAVTTGELPEERLAEAAKRVEQLAEWTVQARTATGSGVPDRPDGTPVGLLAARRAIRLTVADGAAPPPLATAPHVVEFAPPANMAAGAQTPWGVATPLRTRMPGTTAVRLSAADPGAALHPARGRPLVIVVRGIHRYWWMSHAVATLLGVRPVAVVVEMGGPEWVSGGGHLAPY
ncbi:glycoside hydrolase family 3 protein, partial [Micromonospora sp. CPCC 205371]|nr:glycoside hydrolase family 3 protein [Micromonospora sp. CPCC 205371]